MVQLLMSALHKYLNEKPSMCDLQFYTDGAHTQRTFCSHTAHLGLWPLTTEMSKKLLWTFYFSHFLFYLGTMFFSSEVTALIYFVRYTDIETACRSTAAVSKPDSLCIGQWSHMLHTHIS